MRENADKWLLVRLTAGQTMKRIHVLKTSRDNSLVRLITNPAMDISDSDWHGKHDFPRKETDRELLPVWNLCVRYDGDDNLLNHIQCLPLKWLWEHFGMIVYRGFLQDTDHPHCVLTLASEAFTSSQASTSSEDSTSWTQDSWEALNSQIPPPPPACPPPARDSGASQPAGMPSSSGARQPADAEPPRVPVSGGASQPAGAAALLPATLDVARCQAIKKLNIQGAYQRIREALNHLSETTPTPAVDAAGRPLRVAFEHPDVWKHWVASLANIKQVVGPGIHDAYFQFRSHEDPNRVVYAAEMGRDVYQRRLDIIVERVDGSVVVLHPSKNKTQAHFYKRGEFEP